MSAQEILAWRNPHNGAVIDAKRKNQEGVGAGYPNFSQPLVAPAAQAVARNVGDSFFESWYSLYNPEGKSTKQTMREAYEAGMVDHEGRCAPAAQAADHDVIVADDGRVFVPREMAHLYAKPAAQVAQAVADDVVRDAERYRFLRDCVSNTDSPQSLVLDELMGQIDEMVGMEYSDALDAAIDAAMLAAQQQKAGKP